MKRRKGHGMYRYRTINRTIPMQIAAKTLDSSARQKQASLLVENTRKPGPTPFGLCGAARASLDPLREVSRVTLSGAGQDSARTARVEGMGGEDGGGGRGRARPAPRGPPAKDAQAESGAGFGRALVNSAKAPRLHSLLALRVPWLMDLTPPLRTFFGAAIRRALYM